jgi:hypothetical protein
MKRLLVALVLVAVCCSTLPGFAAGNPDLPKWAPGRLMVNFLPSVGKLENIEGHGNVITMGVPSVDELFAKYRVTSMQRIVIDQTLANLKVVPDFYRLVLVYCAPETDIQAMADDFSKNAAVEYAEPDLLYRTNSRSPNDSRWTYQWDKRIMNLPVAWDFSTGSRNVIVCAVDGGVWWKHDDLFDNLWVNPGEDLNGNGLAYDDTTYPGDQEDIDGLDNDGDGFVDDLIGWDFLVNAVHCPPGEDCDSQQDNDPVSVNDHGTHVTGLMAATGNNGLGVAGCNWNIRAMATRSGYQDTVEHTGLIMQDAAVACMTWAVSKGANVLNMSFGSDRSSSTESRAIAACWDNGAIICAAAGNDNGNTSPHYPAAYPYVVCVGSTNNDDHISDFSNYGTWLDCFAPGNMVLSTIIPGYAEYPGTSMASPNCAGVMALMWSIFPAYNNQQIVDLVLNNGQDISGINSSVPVEYQGHGRVDAARALSSTLPYLTMGNASIHDDNDGDGRLEPGETGNLIMTVHNDSAWQAVGALEFTVTSTDPCLSVSNGTFNIDLIDPGETRDNATTPVRLTYVDGVNNEAHYTTLDIAISNADGFHFQSSVVLRVGRPQVLIVADDGQDNYRTWFTTALAQRDANGQYYNFDVWDVRANGDPSLNNIREYRSVAWVCGNETANTLTADNQSVLAQYLDAGGRLMLAGQGVDPDISGTPFYANYLHAEHVDGLGGQSLSGVAGDPISDGTNLMMRGGGCGGNGSVHPSKISPVNGGVTFYTYGAAGSPGGVRFDNGTYKVVYYAFAIEAACANGTTHYSIPVRKTMDWLDVTTTNTDQPRATFLPQGFALHPNYPNPFNPTTTVSFELPYATDATLTVFDLQGRQVEMLAKGRMHAGSHQIQFNGSDLASGVYFVHLQADKFSATERMVLMK